MPTCVLKCTSCAANRQNARNPVPADGYAIMRIILGVEIGWRLDQAEMNVLGRMGFGSVAHALPEFAEP